MEPCASTTLTNCCSFVKTHKVASCLFKERRLSGQPVDGSWQRAAGWDLSDVNLVLNKHSCKSAETVFESVEERSKQHFIWLAGKWLDEWELVDGFTREKPGCLCFHIARLTFTHSRFMPSQSGRRSQPLPVFICTRKSLLAFKTTTKL